MKDGLPACRIQVANVKILPQILTPISHSVHTRKVLFFRNVGFRLTPWRDLMKNEDQHEEGMDEIERVRRQVEAVRDRIRAMSQSDEAR